MRTRRALHFSLLVSLGACNAILGNEEGVFVGAGDSGGKAGGSNGGRGGSGKGGSAGTSGEAGETNEGGSGGTSGVAGKGGTAGDSAGGSSGRGGTSAGGTTGEGGDGATPNAGTGGATGGSSGIGGTAGGGCDPTCQAPTPFCVMGECVECEPNTPARCADQTPETCVAGVWTPGTSCSDSSQVCSNGVCVGRYLFGGIGTTSAVPGGTGRRLVEHGFEGGKAMVCGTNACVAGRIRP